MLFSDFMGNGGFPLFDALSQTYQCSTDLSIDTDGINVHKLVPDADGIVVTMVPPIVAEPNNQIIINDTEYSVNITCDGEIYILPPHMVFFFTWSGSAWVRYQADILDWYTPPLGSVEYKIQASDASLFDNFGYSVSMSGDGTKCIVGAYFESTGAYQAGAAYIFSWNGSTWVEDQILYASDAGSSDRFGCSVSMNADGTKCIVGAYQESSEAGAVYIFSLDGTWSQDQKIVASDAEGENFFGWSVSMSSDGARCIVGAYGDTTVDGDNSGAVYIFSLDGTWSEDQKIMANDVESGDRFGYSVSMSGDGTRCIAGTPYQDTGGGQAGAAYILSLDGTWSHDQKITASDAGAYDYFGFSVSMNADGTKCIVGAYGEDTGGAEAGAVYIFSLDGTWSEDQKIQASDKESSDNFGRDVSMNSDGTKCIVGAWGEDTGGSDAGAAYIFSLDGTWSEDQKIMANDAEENDQFGVSVAINADGTKVIVGANIESAGIGAAYIY